MTLYLLDYGKFENLTRIFDRKLYHRRNYSIDNNNSSEIQYNSESPSKDEEAEDIVPPISTVCQGHIMKTSNSDRRMSVPQLSRNKSIIKTREQRITSVIGVPHRHHITIAVNDEPVDIIKTTCTGPCLQSCHSNSINKTKSSLSTGAMKLQNNPFSTNDPRFSNQSSNIILMTLIYVISTISVRSVINLYIILNDITNVQRKITLAFLYFFAATMTFVLSLNCFSKPLNQNTIRVELILSILLIILWSGLHLIPISSWSLLIFTAVLLGLGSSLLWDSQLTILSRWTCSSSCRPQVGSFNDIISQINIIPTTSIIGHSLHIWSSILIFILLETPLIHPINRNLNLSLSTLPTDIEKINGSQQSGNLSRMCGINLEDFETKKYLKIPDRMMFCLLYICIGLNVISLILVILLLDKSKEVRIPSQSTDKDVIRPMISDNTVHNVMPSNSMVFTGNWIYRGKNYFFIWTRKNFKILNKLWKSSSFKYVMPSLFTMGLVEGFFISDYNQNFITCYNKSSFIGISMLMFAIGPIAFVNIFPLLFKHRMIEIFSSPISRIIFLSSSLLLALSKVGKHWSYLLVFFPWIVSLDTVICLTMFYISVSNLPNNLLDSSLVVHRVLRMLGIATYAFISGVFGIFPASLITVLVHIFISPTIIVLGSLVKCSKN